MLYNAGIATVLIFTMYSYQNFETLDRDYRHSNLTSRSNPLVI